MRQQDIAPGLHQYLVPVEGHPNIKALVAPPTPRHLPVGGSGTAVLMRDALQALGRLEGEMRHWAFPDLLTRTLARREAVQSSQIEGTRTDLGQLLVYEETQAEGSAPRDAQVTERYVQALQTGLEAVRTHGRAGITLALLDQLHATLMQDMGGASLAGATVPSRQ
ncbi:MAG: Fic/DOC family N-terminal domain-containing protein [Stenotrophomonas sp.]